MTLTITTLCNYGESHYTDSGILYISDAQYCSEGCLYA